MPEKNYSPFPNNETRIMRMLALGDSYTIGTGAAASERWPIQLGVLLNKRGFKLESPEIIAANGWTTFDLQKAIAARTFKPPYDLVTLLIGVNDQYNRLGVERYREGFTRLLQVAIALCGGQPAHGIVLSIPDYSVTPFARSMDAQAIHSEIETFNRINQELSDAAAVQYIDITASARLAAEDPSLLVEDRLHPSGKLYARWAQIILPFAEGILGH